MKKRVLSIAVVLILVFALFPATALASSEIIVFPDPNFKAAVLAQMGKQPSDEITKAEAASVVSLYVNGKGISDLSGIEHFTSLRYLECYVNQLTTLDVSNNPALELLFCDRNQLMELDVSNNPALKSFSCYDNQLTMLDVSNNPALEWIECYSNQLTALDVSSTTALYSLDCRWNQLTTLDVSNNLALKTLYCSDNQLTTLDVSNNLALERLDCGNNQLTALDVSNNLALESLGCNSNQLKMLDVSKNPALERLGCGYNQLTTMDVSNSTVLEYLYCTSNQLTTLDVSNNTALETLSCGGNQLTTLDVSNNLVLEFLWCVGNQLTTLDVSKNPALRILRCDYNRLTMLDVSGLYALSVLECSYNNMTDGSNVIGVGDTLLPAIDTEDPPYAYIFSPQRNAPTSPMSRFAAVNSYAIGQFPDVDENQWYGANVQNVIARAYEYGLMKGNNDGSFNPMGNVTIAEAITIAARVHNIYNGGSGEFAQGEPWYQVYVDYAIGNGIIQLGNFTDYGKTATRAEMAYIFSRSLPPAEFAEQNIVNSLPDVNSNTPYSDAIILLYKAGVVTGDTGTFAFRPGDNVSRAEAAAIISRVILPGMRTTGKTY